MADESSISSITPDEDEGFEDYDYESTTSSVRSSILANREEHGRTYHAYKYGQDHRPNDQAELDRLDITNQVFLQVNDGKLHLAPIGDSPDRILDMGAGTGLWAIEVADIYPSAQVIGVDISPSQPNIVPPNVQFEIDDLEDEWTYSQPFDLLHAQYMGSSINNWPALLKQAFEFTKPGGWIEIQDFDIHYYSTDGSLEENGPNLLRWYKLGNDALAKIGRELRQTPKIPDRLKEAGYTNIQTKKTPVPVGTWAKDEKQKRIGSYLWLTVWEGLEAVSLRLFLGVLGWSREDLDALLLEVKKELKNPKVHALLDVHSIWAQKPEA